VKYIPDQVKALEDGLKAAKDALEKKDYKAALNAAKTCPAKRKTWPPPPQRRKKN